MRRIFLSLIWVLSWSLLAYGQEHGDSHDHDTTHEAETHGDQEHECACHPTTAHEYDSGAAAFHHIADANVYSIGPLNIPLPCMLYAPEQGWSFFMSSKFDITCHHGSGHNAVDRYVLDEGSVKRITDSNFPMGVVQIEGIMHDKEKSFACYGGQHYLLDPKSTADGGLFGGGITSFYDFSITKNVTAMILIFILLTWMFLTIAKSYRVRDGQAPKGIQSLIEPVFLFIQDEVAKPFLGSHYMKYQPFLMSLFFFILGLNLFGQIPFFGGSNVTGNLAVTMVLAIIAFLVTNINGNRHYWEHILWMPGVPAVMKLILTPVEFLGLFIKPLTLMLRLFANITAGHMVIVIFVGFIFLFGKSGELAGASYATAIGSTLLTMFMMSIELLVAFIQAFVFTILTASYIGAAIEEPHH